MAREGIPFVLVPLLLGALFGVFGWWPVTVAFGALALFMLYFFRDPERTIPEGDDIVVSAADGKVTRVETRADGHVVSVFLSPLDVHINRSPITGLISRIEYTSGKRLPATSSNASAVNERNTLTIVGPNFTVQCTQIAGILARRIVCWPKEGDNILIGQRFGLIKFSSRTDLLIPLNAKVKVAVGDRVIGGETIIARIEPS